ncbi:MAG: helix-turn-helix domain-containing protein [Candidatus Aminicenantaceae bacterium]
MPSFSEELKQKRESKGKTLAEASESTRISLKFLKAVEENQMQSLPGEFYIKGILRSYSRYLGLDEEEILDKYYQELKLKNHNREKNTNIKRNSFHNSKTKIFLKNFSISIIFLLLISLSLYLISRDTNTNLTMEISVIEETWLQVTADGEIVVEGTKKPEEHFKFKAFHEIILNLGNAGGINFKINNKQGKKLGLSGVDKKNIRITVNNYHQFIKKGNKPEKKDKVLKENEKVMK